MPPYHELTLIPNCYRCIHKDVCSPYRRICTALVAELFLKKHNAVYEAVAKGCSMYQLKPVVKPKTI